MRTVILLLSLASVSQAIAAITRSGFTDIRELYPLGEYMKKTATLALLILVSGTVNAANFSCNVDVQNVLLYNNGSVNVRHSGAPDFTVICNLNSEWKGVSITTCAMWASMLINLQENGKEALFYYSDQNVSSCASLPTYGSSPAPHYIGTTN